MFSCGTTVGGKGTLDLYLYPNTDPKVEYLLPFVKRVSSGVKNRLAFTAPDR
jgi:hypothetical protein